MKYEIKIEHSPRHHGWFWGVGGRGIDGFAMTKWGARRAAEKRARRLNTAPKIITYIYDTDGNHGDYYP